MRRAVGGYGGVVSLCVGPRGERGTTLRAALRAAATILMVFGLTSAALAAPAVADRNQCAPAGLDGATALPQELTETKPAGQDDQYTTPTVEPLSSVDTDALGLSTPGVLTVATLSDAPPNVCINPTGQFSGFDNQLLRAIAEKLGVQVRFVGTDFAGLLAQVASRRFDVGSASVKATEARRHTVAFTNGYDFGYYALVVPPGSPIKTIPRSRRSVSASASSKAPSRSPTSSTP